jgi:D-3-phosphoglycerate dehydrogenase
MNRPKVLIDFDSTFTKVEALDILGEISLDGHPEKKDRLKAIADITDLGMNGEISFAESLIKRIELLNGNLSQIEPLVAKLKTLVSESTKRNRAWFQNYAENIYIVSSGFKEFITPVVAEFGIPEDHVYANEFKSNISGDIVDVNKDIPLSEDQGKVKLMQKLQMEGEVFVIGDGFTDYEIRGAGYADKFFCFVENIRRAKPIAKADHVINGFDDFLEITKLN